MTNSENFYSLSTEDIQNVAQDCLGRDLSDTEVVAVIPEIEKRIAWYDAIYDSIEQTIGSKA